MWVPSSNWNPNSPTLVYMIGYSGKLPKHANSSNEWNKLWILDRSGHEKKGSWFFGESGNPIILQIVEDFLRELILSKLVNENQIYFAGKGMGGHASLYLSDIFSAKGCFVHNPTTNVKNSAYNVIHHKEMFENIFGDDLDHPYRDLREMITKRLSKKCHLKITHNVSKKQKFYLEQLDFFSSLTQDEPIITTSDDFTFDSIFLEFLKHTSKIESPTCAEQHSQPLSPDLPQTFDLVLNSRQPVILPVDFNFDFDPYNDRSWRFWFQNLSWMKDYLHSIPEDARPEAFKTIFQRWMSFTKNLEIDSEFFYHDHSIAYRPTNILECIQYVPEELISDVEDHLLDLGLLLCSPLEDNALSNHSFDQAISLFLISSHFKGRQNSAEWERLALSRIERETGYAFTIDGVHVENSPSYHHGMITNMYNSLQNVYEKTSNKSIRSHIENLKKSVPFLRWIRRLDGKVPPIGDSEEKVVSTNLAKKLAPDEFVHDLEGLRLFGNGYAIWRSDNRKLQATLKSCLHGRFHRHDDDCSVTIWADGENILLDSGLLYYQERDEDRIHVRSSSAHSGFSIPGIRANRDMFEESSSNSFVEKINAVTVRAHLGMYPGYEATRTMMFVGDGYILEDRFCGKSLAKGIKLNFLVDESWDINEDDNSIKFSKNNGKSWQIQFESIEKLPEIKIVETFYSPLRNQKHGAFRIEVTPKESYLKSYVKLDGFNMRYEWEPEPNIFSVMKDSRSMQYRFEPAVESPKSAPTMIILHGHGNYPPAKSKFNDWNVICPLDNYGAHGKGSWWIGEDGERFTSDLLKCVVEDALARVGQTIEKSRLFIYGTSMGGYGAILHGSKLNAVGVYANVPQVKLLGTTYSQRGMIRYFEKLFSQGESDIHNDLTEYLSKVHHHPLYFICENRFGQDGYLSEHCMKLVKFFDEQKLNYHLEIIPTQGHNKNRRISDVKKMFETYCLQKN